MDIGSGNGLTQNRRQAVPQSSNDKVVRRHDVYFAVNAVPTEGLAPFAPSVWRHAITRTNAGVSSIGNLGTNFNEIWISLLSFSFKKMHLKMLSAKWDLIDNMAALVQIMAWRQLGDKPLS